LTELLLDDVFLPGCANNCPTDQAIISAFAHEMPGTYPEWKMRVELFKQFGARLRLKRLYRGKTDHA
jgi:hypothetical protein